MMSDLHRHYGKATVAFPIPRSTLFEQAPAIDGQTILEYQPDSVSAKAYERLVERIYAAYR